MNYAPDFRAMLQIARNNYEMFGFARTLREGLRYLLTVTAKDDFDLRYGVSTSEPVEVSKGGIVDEAALGDALGYSAIREEAMGHILTNATRGLDLSATTFVDLGCGKGRALIMASCLPFRSVIGVELSPLHAQLAEQNLQRFFARESKVASVRCRDVVVKCASATDYSYPETDLLVYMFRPFVGPVLRASLDNLAAFQARTHRRVQVVLCYPREEFVLEAHCAFRKTREFQVIDDTYSWNQWECTGAVGMTGRPFSDVSPTPEDKAPIGCPEPAIDA